MRTGTARLAILEFPLAAAEIFSFFTKNLQFFWIGQLRVSIKIGSLLTSSSIFLIITLAQDKH